MRKMNILKYGLTTLMMSFAMTLCYSCSSDDDEETSQEVNPPSNGECEISGTIDGHDYVELAGIKWATENVGAVDSLAPKFGTYGCYYTQPNAIKAAESWGEHWTLPTQGQWRKLINNCRWERGEKGFYVLDNDNRSKFIFLPAAGMFYSASNLPGGDHGIGNHPSGQGLYGYYWAADNLPSFLKICFSFDDYTKRNLEPLFESFCMSVRPVVK